MVTEMLCVEDLTKHIPIENALIPILCFSDKIDSYNIFNFGHITAHETRHLSY